MIFHSLSLCSQLYILVYSKIYLIIYCLCLYSALRISVCYVLYVSCIVATTYAYCNNNNNIKIGSTAIGDLKKVYTFIISLKCVYSILLCIRSSYFYISNNNNIVLQQYTLHMPKI